MRSHQEPPFLRHLLEWVEEQKRILETLRKSEKDLEKADRLMRILAARVACYHISRTIKGFESWLQNPLIIGVMPEEMVKEMQQKLWEIMYMLIEYDIKHTKEYHDFLKKAIEEQKLPPLLFQVREERRREPRLPYTI